MIFLISCGIGLDLHIRCVTNANVQHAAHSVERDGAKVSRFNAWHNGVPVGLLLLPLSKKLVSTYEVASDLLPVYFDPQSHAPVSAIRDEILPIGYGILVTVRFDMKTAEIEETDSPKRADIRIILRPLGCFPPFLLWERRIRQDMPFLEDPVITVRMCGVPEAPIQHIDAHGHISGHGARSLLTPSSSTLRAAVALRPHDTPRWHCR
jgi:hypothetical protein